MNIAPVNTKSKKYNINIRRSHENTIGSPFQEKMKFLKTSTRVRYADMKPAYPVPYTYM